MPQLRMLSSRQGSPDGHRVQWFLEGHTYDVSESLTAIFLKEGWAEPADAPAAAPELPQAKAAAASAPKQEYRRRR